MIGSFRINLRRRGVEMSKANGNPRGRPRHKYHRVAPPEPGDEQSAYTHAQLIRMDNRFRARLLRAFRKGLESRESAANQLSVTRYRTQVFSSSLQSAALLP